MQLHKVKEVKSVTSVNSGNDALPQSLALIAVVSESSGGPCYVLGKSEAPPEKESIGLMQPAQVMLWRYQ